MTKTNLLLIVTYFIIGIFSMSTTHASTISFSCISYNITENCLAGENQFSVDIINNSPGQVLFHVQNNGIISSSIEGVYFDDGTLLGVSQLVDSDENNGLSGVDFTAGSASPPELPSAQKVNPIFQTTAGFLADSDPPVSRNGINTNEWLDIVFELQTGTSYDDVIAQLQNGQLRIGLHAQSINDTGSESFVNNLLPIPIGSPLLMLFSGIFSLSLVKKVAYRKAI